MAKTKADRPSRAKIQSEPTTPPGWSELWQKEDWWAVWLGLGIVIVAIIAFLAGGTIKPIAVKPASWDSFAALGDHFAAQWQWYAAQLLLCRRSRCRAAHLQFAAAA